MSQQKKNAAQAALEFIEPGMVVGVGTGSTVNFFIEALASRKHDIEGAVASSAATAQKLKALSIPLLDLNSTGTLPLYVDGADEVNPHKQLLKGGGGALTREKILAVASKKFVCIVDSNKRVDLLGEFPVAIEVIPMARSYVARELVQMGADPVYRQGFVTDNGNVILDVYNMKILEPVTIEAKIKGIVGVVESGIFGRREADVVLVGTESGVERF